MKLVYNDFNQLIEDWQAHGGAVGGGGAVERRAQFTQDHGCDSAGRLQTATSESFSIECARQRQLAAGQHGEPSV